MLTAFVVREGRVTQGPVDSDSLAALLEDRDTHLWVDLEDPTPEEFDLLADVFRFHPLALEDCRIRNELPKLDDYGSELFLVLHSPVRDSVPGSFSAVEHHFFLGARFVVTVHGPSVVIADARREALKDSFLFKRGMDFLLHGLVDRIADRYLLLLEDFDRITDNLETRVIERPESKLLEDVLTVKRNLLYLVRVSHLQRDIVLRLSRDSFPQISEKARLYFRDVYDHLFQVASMAEFFRDTISGIRDAYLSVVSNRLNEIMKVLTIFATLMLPLTVVTGIYGMNFEWMPELTWRYGYPAVLLLMGAIEAGLLIYFKRKGWW